MRTVNALYRFPVKGLSPERLSEVALRAGHGFPSDRSYAITDGTWKFDPAAPQPMPKTRFLMLAKYERLAMLDTRFDEKTRVLEVTRDGETVSFGLAIEAERHAAARYFSDHLAGGLVELPEIVHAEGHQFTDVSVHSVALMRSISLINLASVRALAAEMDTPIDPLRFRANLLFDGGVAWEEFDWLDREIEVGEVLLRVVRRTKRCAATTVNRETATRDLNIPVELNRHYGHGDLGVYAEVLRGGSIRTGAQLKV